ncbi:MAG TPA: ABC transporter substrate-binding protein [Rhodoblastus sp.]|nr:ABC transporter substrate-binding protein [Rhodoblastus sp.]
MRFFGCICLALMLAASTGSARSEDGPIKIGVLEDMSGPYADVSGPGSVIAARLAAEDFGPALGRKVEILAADHANKADIGTAIAKRWFDVDKIDMIVGMGNSAVALAVRGVASSKGVVDINTSAGTGDLTGKACSPTSFHWVYDTYALAKTIGTATIRSGADTFFMIAADYNFGTIMAQDTTKFATAAGGKSVGGVRVPLNTADFSSYILQAQSARAKAIMLAIAGQDLINFIKQSNEFNVVKSGQKLASFVTFVNDVHALGLNVTQGLLTAEAFYWDLNDDTRRFSRRFQQVAKKMPNSMQAGVYSAVTHYLKAVKAVGGTDGKLVAAKMRELPVDDFMTKNAKVREDGRVMRDFYLFQAKAPQDSKGEWDLLAPIEKLPDGEAFRPLAESECPLVKAAVTKN